MKKSDCGCLRPANEPCPLEAQLAHAQKAEAILRDQIRSQQTELDRLAGVVDADNGLKDRLAEVEGLKDHWRTQYEQAHAKLDYAIQWVEDHVFGWKYEAAPSEMGVKASTALRMALKQPVPDTRCTKEIHTCICGAISSGAPISNEKVPDTSVLMTSRRFGKSTQQELLQHCQNFINDERIRCAESVYQTDRVIEHAYQFIEGICEIVGYFKDPEETEKECKDGD